MIEGRDDWLHRVGPDPAWQESFCFNWADPERRSFTLARTGSDAASHCFWRILRRLGPCDRI